MAAALQKGMQEADALAAQFQADQADDGELYSTGSQELVFLLHLFFDGYKYRSILRGFSLMIFQTLTQSQDIYTGCQGIHDVFIKPTFSSTDVLVKPTFSS